MRAGSAAELNTSFGTGAGDGAVVAEFGVVRERALVTFGSHASDEHVFHLGDVSTLFLAEQGNESVADAVWRLPDFVL